jgi:rhodanese-related sulfurtransferase
MDFEVTRDELKGKIERHERFVLVESQSPMMFEDAHLPGAVNVPPDRVAALAPALLKEKDAEIIVYCSGPT